MSVIGGWAGCGYHTRNSFEFASGSNSWTEAPMEVDLADHNLLITSICSVLCLKIKWRWSGFNACVRSLNSYPFCNRHKCIIVAISFLCFQKLWSSSLPRYVVFFSFIGKRAATCSTMSLAGRGSHLSKVVTGSVYPHSSQISFKKWLVDMSITMYVPETAPLGSILWSMGRFFLSSLMSKTLEPAVDRTQRLLRLSGDIWCTKTSSTNASTRNFRTGQMNRSLMSKCSFSVTTFLTDVSS